MCKRSEAKAFLRHGRVTFEGDVVTRPEQRVVVRYVRGPRASKTARLPRGSTTWTFSRRAIFATCFGKAAQKRRRSRRAPRFQTQAVRRRARGRQAHPRLARRRQGERRHGEGGVTRRSRTSTRDQRTASHRARRTCTTIYCTLKTFHLVEKRVVENARTRLFVATFVASSPAKAAARERSGDLSRTPRRVADRAPIPDPATGPRARRARRPRTPHPAANRAARGAPATGRPATPALPALAR